MVDPDADLNRMPMWSWAAPAVAGVLVAAKLANLVSADSMPVILLAVGLLGGAVFAAVHHAEVLAVRIGEPFGSILLALAITTLEVGLIISVMAAGLAGSDAVARDTVYSVVMIVLNGIVGICLVGVAGSTTSRSSRCRARRASSASSRHTPSSRSCCRTLRRARPARPTPGASCCSSELSR